MKDMRSELAKARDKWLEENREQIQRWAAEANINAAYIENRLINAFLSGAKVSAKLAKEST